MKLEVNKDLDIARKHQENTKFSYFLQTRSLVIYTIGTLVEAIFKPLDTVVLVINILLSIVYRDWEALGVFTGLLLENLARTPLIWLKLPFLLVTTILTFLLEITIWTPIKKEEEQ